MTTPEPPNRTLGQSPSLQVISIPSSIGMALWGIAASGVAIAAVLAMRLVPSKDALPPPNLNSIAAPAAVPDAIVEVEMERLITQARKDIVTPESACFGRSTACPLGHYEFDGLVKQEAAHRLLQKVGEQP